MIIMGYSSLTRASELDPVNKFSLVSDSEFWGYKPFASHTVSGCYASQTALKSIKENSCFFLNKSCSLLLKRVDIIIVHPQIECK